MTISGIAARPREESDVSQPDNRRGGEHVRRHLGHRPARALCQFLLARFNYVMAKSK